MRFRFKIDEKSLFYWIYNDYLKWQTATVHTPINQSKDPNKRHKDIMQLHTSGLESKNLPNRLLDQCLPKTTSNATSKINYFFEFKDIYLDWNLLHTKSSFWMYIKEEVDEYIINRQWTKVKNTHLWREKLHYPISLKYKTDWFNIDNKNVLDCILDQNWWFAYVVRWFECDTNDKSLNFLTSIIWLKWICLSNVFKRQKWVWKKLLINEVNLDSINLEAQDLWDDNFALVSDFTTTNGIDFDQINESRKINGKKWEEFVLNNITSLISKNIKDVYHTSKDYPTSPYDIEYIENWIKKYLEVKSTSWTRKIFNMSSWEIKFMEKYAKDYLLILVTDVKNEFPHTDKYQRDDILLMKKEYPSTRFYVN